MTSEPSPTPGVAHSPPQLVLLVVLIGSIAGVVAGAWTAGFLHLPSNRTGARQTPPPLLQKATFPRLAASYTTATRAGSDVVGVVAPAGGPVRVLIIPPNGVSPPADDVQIRVTQGGHTLTPRPTPCGTWCYRVPATVFGGSTTTIAVQIRGTPTKAVLTLPARMPADAATLYRRAVTRMTNARGMMATQSLSSGGPPIITRYTAEAPDRLRYVTSTGLHTVLIGHRRWDLRADGWVECPFAGAHAPAYVWQGAAAPRLAGHRIVDGRRIDIVHVFNPSVPAWFSLDTTAGGRVLDAHMVAPSHFMHESYRLDQNAKVRPPVKFGSGAAC